MGKIMSKKEMLKEQAKMKRDRKLLEENPYTGNYVIKNTILIMLSTILFIGLCYLVVNVAKGNINLFTKENDEVTTIENAVMCGTMFGKSEDEEYYVLAYDFSDDNEKAIYDGIKETVDSTKTLYVLDLSSGFNKTCVGEKNVISNDITKLKLSEPTLLVIKDSKITKNLTTLDKIRDYLAD